MNKDRIRFRQLDFELNEFQNKLDEWSISNYKKTIKVIYCIQTTFKILYKSDISMVMEENLLSPRPAIMKKHSNINGFIPFYYCLYP